MSEAKDFLAGKTPLVFFADWLTEAARSHRDAKDGREFGAPRHAEAFTLATVGHDGHPSSRVVLLKELRTSGANPGLVFYSNYTSRKGQEIDNEAHISASFYWDALARQVLFRGPAQKISRAESQKYWDSRERASQLSQWVSHQSKPVASRDVMEKAWAEAEVKFAGQPVPLPPHWGGYLLTPTYVEFWIGREGRFHDRYAYHLDSTGVGPGERLSP